MLRVTGGVRHCNQFNTPFSRGAVIFPVVTISAGACNIRPDVFATSADRDDMVTGELTGPERISTIEAKVSIACE